MSGAVQVPGSRQPIVLMVDNQTTGGYPKIATVISADVPLVARRKPGRSIRFVEVDVREAARLLKRSGGVRVEGVALHLPLAPRSQGTSHLSEVERLMKGGTARVQR